MWRNRRAPEPHTHTILRHAEGFHSLLEDAAHQKVVERELKRGELCSVLVSRPRMVTQGGYSKVISWVDEDSMGIVRAELYDSKSKLLKIFEPKSFKKINGQWHLKEMEMRNEQTNTRTSILFDLEEAVKPPPK